MPFESPEKILKQFLEKRDSEKLENYLETISRKLREEGFPIGERCRIDIAAFEDKLYPKKVIEEDTKLVKQKESEFGSEKSEKKELGEMLEEYVTCLFNKHFRQEWLTVRSSLYDDFTHHVDNLVVDIKTGLPICAFDEVGDMEGVRYEEKRGKILKRNIGLLPGEGGVKIKYGFSVVEEKGSLKPKLKALKHIPIFYIALSRGALKSGIEEFSFSKENSSPYELKMLQYFLSSIESQINGLMLEEKKLHPELKSSLLRFKETIKEIKKGMRFERLD